MSPKISFFPNVRVLALIMLSLATAACNMPRKATPTPPGANILYTAAAETVMAQLTQMQLTISADTPQSSGIPTVNILPTSTDFPPTATSIPPTTTSIPCDRVEFVKDVTYPDDTQVAQGLVFVKTWRLRNSGSCTWTTNYALVFTGGDAMGAPAAVPLSSNVPPGQTVDISVTLTAPNTSGTYRGDFKLRNASNAVFGLGSSNKPFFVKIIVGSASGILFDFISQASAAQWESGSGGVVDTSLTFGGADDDVNGAAKIKQAVDLENGNVSSKILLTFPKHQVNGFIAGTYPSYQVQSGDQFKARLGFMAPGGACGVGKVKFQLLFKEGTIIKTAAEWTKTCNGSLLPVDVDLSSLKGKNVQFLLVVRAQGPFDDDWAIWSSPRIEHP